MNTLWIRHISVAAATEPGSFLRSVIFGVVSELCSLWMGNGIYVEAFSRSLDEFEGAVCPLLDWFCWCLTHFGELRN